MGTLRGIGFWFSESEPELPHPAFLAGSPLYAADGSALAGRLEHGDVFVQYAGTSWCRFQCCTRSDLGSRDLTDGRWVWPEGLAHYVKEHRVRLPEEFVSDLAIPPKGARQPFARNTEPRDEVSRAFWIGWAQAQGAAIDISNPWHVITQDPRSSEVKEIMRELLRELPATHPLAAFAWRPRWPNSIDFADRILPRLRAAALYRVDGRMEPARSEMELVARRLDRDDILLRLVESPRLALVRLTRSGHEEPDGFPETQFFETWAEWNGWRKRTD
jgi:hypothetical protein